MERAGIERTRRNRRGDTRTEKRKEWTGKSIQESEGPKGRRWSGMIFQLFRLQALGKNLPAPRTTDDVTAHQTTLAIDIMM